LVTDCCTSGTGTSSFDGHGDGTAVPYGDTPYGDTQGHPYRPAAVQQQANTDKSAVDAMGGRWVPQLSSKQPGTHDDGIVYDDNSIWQEHTELRHKYGAYLMWVGGYWITIADTSYFERASAQAWCDRAGRDADHCFPRLIAGEAAQPSPSQAPTQYVVMAGTLKGVAPGQNWKQWRVQLPSLSGAEAEVIQDCLDGGHPGCHILGHTTGCMAANSDTNGNWYVGYGPTHEAAVQDLNSKVVADNEVPIAGIDAHCAWDAK
jgi:hypothetical protein